MTEQGWTVTREHIAGETNGRTSLDGSRRIIVDDKISDAQAAKTMIHEAAHALMHANGDIDPPAELHRGRAEVEAESVAYVLAGLLGLDTTDYSIGYIAGWGKRRPRGHHRHRPRSPGDRPHPRRGTPNPPPTKPRTPQPPRRQHPPTNTVRHRAEGARPVSHPKVYERATT